MRPQDSVESALVPCIQPQRIFFTNKASREWILILRAGEEQLAVKYIEITKFMYNR
jgi:hypothetical protein